MHCPSQLVMFCFLLVFLHVSRSKLISENLVRDRDNIILTKEPLSSVKVRSKLQCPIKCVETEDCGFVLFNAAQKICKLYTDGDGETTPEDGWISWRAPAQPAPLAPPTPLGMDCAEILENDPTAPDGVYVVKPTVGEGAVSVFCDMTDDGGGWTVIQRRTDGSEDFYRDWEAYKNGFGSLTNEFWLGNNVIWRLTNQRYCDIKFELVDWRNDRRDAYYYFFEIKGESENFTLSLGGFHGNAGDSFTSHEYMMFSTKDRDNDSGFGYACADYGLGGWWYNDCINSNLNGVSSI